MSVHQLNKDRPLAVVRDVQSRRQDAHNYQCGHCERSALTEVNGNLVIVVRHGGETHRNAYSIRGVINDYIKRADPQQLEQIQRQIKTRCSALAMGGADDSREPQSRFA